MLKWLYKRKYLVLEAKQESSGKAAKIRTGITDYSALNSMCCCSA